MYFGYSCARVGIPHYCDTALWIPHCTTAFTTPAEWREWFKDHPEVRHKVEVPAEFKDIAGKAQATAVIPVVPFGVTAKEMQKTTPEHSSLSGTPVIPTTRPSSEAEARRGGSVREVSPTEQAAEGGRKMGEDSRDHKTDIVVAWNHTDLTQRLFDSIRANTPREMYDLIYVDNGPDCAGDVLLHQFADVTAVRLPSNTGFVHGAKRWPGTLRLMSRSTSACSTTTS